MHGKSRTQRQSYERKRGYGKSRNRTGSAEFKEGTALNNDTQLITATTAPAVHDTETLIKTAEVATALTLGFRPGLTEVDT